MTSNKLIDLLKILSKEEKNAFIQFLKDRLLPKLEDAVKVIFQLIEKKQFNNANYYAKCYGKQYDKKKDYLIRNDFRRILSVFKVFIKNVPIKDNENDMLYFKFLIEKGLHQQVVSFYNKSIEQLNKENDYSTQIQFIAAYIKYIEIQQLASSEKFKTLIDLNEEKKTLLIAQFSKQFRETELINVFLKRNYQAYFPDYKIELSKEKIQINTTEHNYENYLFLKAKNYTLQGKIKIEWLKKCINFLSKNEIELSGQTNVPNELLALNASIALEYFLMNDFNKSYETYTDILKFLETTEITSPNKPAIIFNFVTTCLKLGKYKVALLAIKNDLKALSSIPAFALKTTCILNMCYLMLNQASSIKVKDLEALLTQQIELSEKIYVRIIIAIYYFEINKYDLAEIEIQNSYQFIHHHEELKNYNELILVLKKIIGDGLDNPSELEKNINMLKTDFEHTQINLPILWMEKQLNQ